MAVDQTAAPNTQDLKVASADFTPKAAIFWMSQGTTDGAWANHIRYSIGFADGTNERCVAARCRNGVGATECDKLGSNSHSLIFLSNTANSIVGSFAFDSWIAPVSGANGGVRINWDDELSAAFLLNYMLIGGDDVEAAVGDIMSSTTIGGTASVTGLSGKPDVVLFASSVASDWIETITADAKLGFGWAVRGDSDAISQACAAWGDEDNQVNTQHGSNGDTALCMTSVALSSGATKGQGADLTAWNSDGFTLTTRELASAMRIGYLSLRGTRGPIDAWSGGIDSEIATGSKAYTNPGWKPQALFELGSLLGTDGGFNAGNNGEPWSLGAATDDGAWMHAIRANNGVNPADVESLSNTRPAQVNFGGGSTLGVSWTHTSMDVGGWTQNYTLIRAVTKRQWFLAIREPGTDAQGRGGIEALGSGTPAPESAPTARGGVEADSQGQASPESAPTGRGLAAEHGTGGSISDSSQAGRGQASIAGRALPGPDASLSGRGLLELLGRGSATLDQAVTATGRAYAAAFGLGDAATDAGMAGSGGLATPGQGAPFGLSDLSGRGLVEVLSQGQAAAAALAGFYEGVSQDVRALWLAAGETGRSLATWYDNLPFTVPATDYAQASVAFDETEVIDAGGSSSRVIARGTLEVRIFGALHEGKDPLLQHAEALRLSFSDVTQGRVRFTSPDLSGVARAGGRYAISLRCPFWADDDDGTPLQDLSPPLGDGGFEEVADVIRQRMEAQVATPQGISVQYPNLPFTPPQEAAWMRVSIVSLGATQGQVGSPGKLHDLEGLFTVQVFTPYEEGDQSSLALVDAIDQAFRAVNDRGIQFDAPQPTRGRRSGNEWQRNVTVRWSTQTS